MSYLVQGTGEWLSARRGKLTASRVADAFSRNKNGKWSASREKLMMELVADRMTDASVDHFTSAAMRWGIEQEPNAKAEYEERTGEILIPATFVDHPTIDGFGATPDSYRGRDGVVEIKCPQSDTHVSYIRADAVPEAYQPQILAQLACTRRTHALFISYDPRNKIRPLFVKEWEPDPAEIAAIESMAREFLEELEHMFAQVTGVPA